MGKSMPSVELQNLREKIKLKRLSYSEISILLENTYDYSISSLKIRKGIENDTLPRDLLKRIDTMIDDLPVKSGTGSNNIPRKYRDNNENYIEITDEMRERLDYLLTETKINIAQLCRYKPDNVAAFTPVNVSGWRSGRVITANKDAWNYLENYLDKIRNKFE